MTWRALIDWDWQTTVVTLSLAGALAGLMFWLGRRRAAALGIVLVFSVQGTLMALGGWEDDGKASSKQWNLDVVRVQMRELADRLRAYKARHGRYPTNDEHLGVLDDFDVRFAAPIGYGPGGGPLCGCFGWPAISYTYAKRPEYINILREEARGPLASKQQLAMGLMLMTDVPGVEIAVGKRETMLILRDGLACSPWGVPYVYENRKGFAASVFAHSPANYDGRGLYSVKVDEGVYLWSAGGKVMADDLSALEWRELIPRLLGGLLLSAAVAIGVWWAVRRQWRMGAAGVVGILVLVLGGSAYHAVHVIRVSILWPEFYRRDPAMFVLQQHFLTRYRDSGVITDATYQRALNAANPAPPAGPAATSQATTQATAPSPSQATTQATQPAEGR